MKHAAQFAFALAAVGNVGSALNAAEGLLANLGTAEQVAATSLEQFTVACGNFLSFSAGDKIITNSRALMVRAVSSQVV